MLKSTQYLGQKQSQQQRLSPQQIQYIKLLQLPTIALEQRIKEEMEVNPVLEEASPEEQTEENLQEAPGQDEWEEEGEEELEPVDQNEDIDWEEFLHDVGDDESYTTSYNPDREELRELPNPYQETLLEELENQVTLLNLNEREEMIATQVLGSLDADGYFRRNVESLVDNIAFNQGTLVTEEEVEKVRKQIMRLDPPGMGAKDLRECLLVQLEVHEDQSEECKLAYKILDEHWNEFEKKHFEKLIKRLDVDEDTLRDAYECIQLLDPKPGAGGDMPSNNQNYIEPDFEVYYQPMVNEEGEEDPEQEGEFVISLNSRNVPPLRISPRYKQMWDDIKKKKRKKKKQENHTKSREKQAQETQNFIKSKIESARWFIDSIRQRQNTLMAVMKTIVALQEHFFKFGEGLKPMILKDVADRVNLDISTISRVVNGKYVQTNFGVFELKYFFSEGIQTTSGEEVSSREVKDLLQQVVDNEDKKKPLSDQALAKKLKEHGYKVARRTVSKYREQLNIPVARLRKQIM